MAPVAGKDQLPALPAARLVYAQYTILDAVPRANFEEYGRKPWRSEGDRHEIPLARYFDLYCGDAHFLGRSACSDAFLGGQG